MDSVFSGVLPSIFLTLFSYQDDGFLVEFSDGVCQYPDNSLSLPTFLDCLLIASQQAPLEIKSRLLESSLLINPDLVTTSLYFTPEWFGLLSHLVGVLLFWLLLHVFFVILPRD